MVTVNAHFDGNVIVLDEPVTLQPNQKLRVSIETVEGLTSDGADKPKRQLGLQRDTNYYLAPDWDEPLPDDIWEHNKDEQDSQ